MVVQKDKTIPFGNSTMKLDIVYRYCDYLHGCRASDAPLFFGSRPQQPHSKQPLLPAKSGKKKNSAKAKAGKESMAALEGLHLGYTVQEVTLLFRPD